ncbi:unnamed protein product [Caenorhabditis angaria]|uniref:CUB domain-containing protein n=1 Tax=Caenorhabditis angaria TaxID=860376 RepID=A0A9P1J557_9PELO|nr:unnamed protein product [Caenorhabditis angaria]
MIILFLNILVHFCLSQKQDEILLIQTPNWPKPYSGQLSWKQRVDVEPNQGVAVIFEQFLASAHDCVIACPMSDDACSSICGDAMDHGLVPKILRVNQSTAFLAMVSIDQNDGFPHSGIFGKVISYDLLDDSFFDCGSFIELKDGQTYYFISQNYPNTPNITYSSCNISFSSNSRKGIRFAIYDFNLDYASNFRIYDEEISEDVSGFATEDEPVPYYFENGTANISFSFSDKHSFLEKRFYILVNSYEIPTSKNENCLATGLHSLKISEKVNFGTPDFSTEIYQNNLDCNYGFTRKTQNSYFALAIQYESEKCCDTMNVDGLSKYEEIYQGFQSSNLFLSQSENISFSFQSDEVVGATGFTASIQHIDCSCPSDMVLIENSQLTSTGFNEGAITYCPSLNCLTNLYFNQSKYDLIIHVNKFKLRSYTQTDDVDFINILNPYTTSLANMNYKNGQVQSILGTVSPLTVQFHSTNLTVFPLTQSGIGFDFGLELAEKKYVTKYIEFSETHTFEDVSNMNLNSSETFEYKIKGRPGTKISVYFFTSLQDKIFVDLFDGSSTLSSPLIDNRALYNAGFQGYSTFLQSSSEYAILHIRSNPKYLNLEVLDFQAMITDVTIDSKSNCGKSLVYSMNLGSSGNISLNGENCQKILHFTDMNYLQNSYFSLNLPNEINLNVYFGLSKNNLIGTGQSSLPPMIFSNYLLLEYSYTSQVDITFTSGISASIFATTFYPNQTIFLTSSDYLKTTMATTQQTFSIQMLGGSNVQTGLSIEFLADSPNSQIDIEWERMFQNVVTRKSLNGVTSSQKFDSCGNQVWITYQSPPSSGNGLYAKISQANLQCSSSNVHFSMFTLIMFTILTSIFV